MKRNAFLLPAVLLALGPFALGAEESGAAFPLPLGHYPAAEGAALFEILRTRAAADPFNLVATVIFLLAIVHTFLATKFMHLAHRWRDEHRAQIRARETNEESAALPGAKEPVSFKAEIMHFLGEVEAIFGIWVVPLIVAVTLWKG